MEWIIHLIHIVVIIETRKTMTKYKTRHYFILIISFVNWLHSTYEDKWITKLKKNMNAIRLVNIGYHSLLCLLFIECVFCTCTPHHQWSLSLNSIKSSFYIYPGRNSPTGPYRILKTSDNIWLSLEIPSDPTIVKV